MSSEPHHSPIMRSLFVRYIDVLNSGCQICLSLLPSPVTFRLLEQHLEHHPLTPDDDCLGLRYSVAIQLCITSGWQLDWFLLLWNDIASSILPLYSS